MVKFFFFLFFFFFFLRQCHHWVALAGLEQASYFCLLSDRIKGVRHHAGHSAFSWFIKK
ncbi:hypothetical protein I79_020643 [Cricetulus griseus]|uniref:Secreted protein n=1 Tax=Cricetulus griseus TaxID=10029 RepID=G3IAL8_CRIGR|nr:hypothetical protein I79_020643 [Cricetulus griseus]